MGGRIIKQNPLVTEEIIERVLTRNPNASIKDIQKAGAKGGIVRLSALVRAAQDKLGIPRSATNRALVVRQEVFAGCVGSGWQRVAEAIDQLKGVGTHEELISILEGLGGIAEALKSQQPLIGANGEPMTDAERINWYIKACEAFSLIEGRRDSSYGNRQKWRNAVQASILKSLKKCFPTDVEAQKRVFNQIRVDLMGVQSA